MLPIASLMTEETSSSLSRRSTSTSRGWVAHWLTFTQEPSNGQLKMAMEFLMIWSSQMDSVSRIHLQRCYLHSIGPRLPRASSLCQEAHGDQHTMAAFNFIGLKESTLNSEADYGRWQHCNHVHCSKLQGFFHLLHHV